MLQQRHGGRPRITLADLRDGDLLLMGSCTVVHGCRMPTSVARAMKIMGSPLGAPRLDLDVPFLDRIGFVLCPDVDPRSFTGSSITVVHATSDGIHGDTLQTIANRCDRLVVRKVQHRASSIRNLVRFVSPLLNKPYDHRSCVEALASMFEKVKKALAAQSDPSAIDENRQIVLDTFDKFDPKATGLLGLQEFVQLSAALEQQGINYFSHQSIQELMGVIRAHSASCPATMDDDDRRRGLPKQRVVDEWDKMAGDVTRNRQDLPLAVSIAFAMVCLQRMELIEERQTTDRLTVMGVFEALRDVADEDEKVLIVARTTN